MINPFLFTNKCRGKESNKLPNFCNQFFDLYHQSICGRNINGFIKKFYDLYMQSHYVSVQSISMYMLLLKITECASTCTL